MTFNRTENEMNSEKIIKIGTRASALALWQAHWCASILKKAGFQVEIIHITASGDHPETFSQPIPTGGAQGIFTKEIQDALLKGSVDLAVHSLKDLPTETVPGLHLAAVPERAPTEDALVLGKSAETALKMNAKNGNENDFQTRIHSLEDLPDGTVLGTSSLRRRAQLLLYARTHGKSWQILNVRGNLNTRFRKLDAGEYDALILACAGVERLAMSDRITAVLSPEEMFPAVSQGALGLETRSDDTETNEIVRKYLNSETVFSCVTAERVFLKALDGGCATPIGGTCRFSPETGEYTLRGRVTAVDGRTFYEDSVSGKIPSVLGETLAQRLIGRGADVLIREARERAE